MANDVESFENPEQDVSPDEGGVYVTRNVPDMWVEVLNPHTISTSVDHDATPAGHYGPGEKTVVEGPTAHMLEARGIVKILDVAGDEHRKEAVKASKAQSERRLATMRETLERAEQDHKKNQFKTTNSADD